MTKERRPVTSDSCRSRRLQSGTSLADSQSSTLPSAHRLNRSRRRICRLPSALARLPQRAHQHQQLVRHTRRRLRRLPTQEPPRTHSHSLAQHHPVASPQRDSGIRQTRRHVWSRRTRRRGAISSSTVPVSAASRRRHHRPSPSRTRHSKPAAPREPPKVARPAEVAAVRNVATAREQLVETTLCSACPSSTRASTTAVTTPPVPASRSSDGRERATRTSV